MSKRLKLRLVGSFDSRSDVAGTLRQPGDAALVERGRPRLLVILCPCACGEEFAINLDRQAGKAWTAYRRGSAFTLFPSVWRDTGCKSHFIVWNDTVYLFDRWADDDLLASGGAVNPDTVVGILTKNWQSFAGLAEQLNAIPWDVLAACRELAARGIAVEGLGELSGHFQSA